MNVWICRQNTELECRLIDRFKRAGHWKRVIWCDNALTRPRQTTDLGSVSAYANWSFRGLPSGLRRQADAHLPIYTMLAGRNSLLGGFELDSRPIFDYVHEFNMLVDFTAAKLADNEISIVIFNRAPHYEGDYILYLMAQLLQIPTLIMQQSLFPSKFFYVFSLDDFGRFESAEQIFSPTCAAQLEDRLGKEFFYMKKSNKASKPVRRLHGHWHSEYRLIKELIQLGDRVDTLSRYVKKRRFLKNLRAIADKSPDLAKSYVYFPLHLQPELTTSVFGGQYADQIRAIEELSGILPSGWEIYVKENPKQNYLMRGPAFYERLAKIGNVVYLDPLVDTHKLIKECRAVGTVTGTVGWEAITTKKPVIFFGPGAWYRTLPGTFEFHQKMNLEHLADYTIDREEVLRSASELTRRMGDGIVYPGYEKLLECYDPAENCERVATSLERIIDSKFADRSDVAAPTN